MAHASDFLLGEYPRTLDERYRLTLPSELTQTFAPEAGQYAQCILAKKRIGCLSLWPTERRKKS